LGHSVVKSLQFMA